MKIYDWKQRKIKKEKISMLTCYDFTFAKILNQTKIDALLVGDSSSMVVHGADNTIGSKVQDLALMCASVVKGAKDKFVVCDLPFGFAFESQDKFVEGIKLIMSSGAHAVKIEGVTGIEDRISMLIHMGVPVMGHLGLTPQAVQKFGGFKVQGKSDESRKDIFQSAIKLQELGVFAVVLECVPNDLAEAITNELYIPTIGIGAGINTDGQILVLHDFLGLTEFKAKFVRQYLEAGTLVKSAVDNYVEDVTLRKFPNEDESYV